MFDKKTESPHRYSLELLDTVKVDVDILGTIE